MPEPTRDAHCVAASILANEVRQRIRRYAPNDLHEMAVTVELDKIVRELREGGVLKRGKGASAGKGIQGPGDERGDSGRRNQEGPT